MSESRPEFLARFIVSSILQVPVTRHDDGTADGMVDALIRYPSHTGALEIIGDHDSDFEKQDDALTGVHHRLEFPELSFGWNVVVGHRSRVGTLRKRLPALLQSLEAASINDTNHPTADLSEEQHESLERLSLCGAYTTHSIPKGQVRLQPVGWDGNAKTGRLNQWIEETLATQADVPRKLLLHVDATERHAFVWITIGTNYSIQFELMDNDRELATYVPPMLPDGVTHIWIASGSATQGVISWFPDRGWWKPDWRWPEDGLEKPLEPWRR